jgi:hypothetical protein
MNAREKSVIEERKSREIMQNHENESDRLLWACGLIFLPRCSFSESQ